MQGTALGLDIGSVEAKLAVVSVTAPLDSMAGQFEIKRPFRNGWLLAGRVKVKGDPLRAAAELLARMDQWPQPLYLQITGSHGKMVSDRLRAPYINEFKAAACGVTALLPEVKTILEIGGDNSRYIRVAAATDGAAPAIIDYERNGDCAAGTGSFIDQQAQRLRFQVEEIGGLVLTADTSANIAGRCSVFAKSDMVHAQQRGYSPAAIFKGLCEAVVRNYKGAILRGKTIVPPVALIGGVAANAGVVQALREILGLQVDELIVPVEHFYATALGCAVLPCTQPFDGHLESLTAMIKNADQDVFRPQRLSLDLVEFAQPPALQERSNDLIDVYLGIDVGSVSTNLVLLDEQGWVLDEIYTRTDGRPVEVVQRELGLWKKKWADRVRVLAVGATGSGRDLAGELVGADAVNDEITAHKTGAAFIAEHLYQSQVDTIFEIGGQDSKFISIENGVVVDFTMNEACAAGTGSFLEEQASKLGISIVDEFAELAFASATPVQMGERCTVFMEKDVTAHLQQGVAIKDIAAGLAYSVVQNYLNRVVRDRHIGEVIYFQGGTAYNKAVAAAFAGSLQKRIIVPPHNGVMGAIGAALLAKEKMAGRQQPSRFYGFDLKVSFSIRHFQCKACSNHCEIQQVTVNGEKTFWGDKCSERYRKKGMVEKKTLLPDLTATYLHLLEQDQPGANGSGVTVGFPKAMYYYDRFPFWRGYFSALGVRLTVTETTNRPLVDLAREHCIAEPCFPIIAGHGHVVQLLAEHKVDYVFVANAINSETDFMQTESWFCPWGQTLPLVLRNSMSREDWRKRLLSPVVRFRDGQESVEASLYEMARSWGISRKRHCLAVQAAYEAQGAFRRQVKMAGLEALQTLAEQKGTAIVLVGRAYNLYDPGLNLNIPAQLRDQYGVDVIPMDFIPFAGIDVTPYHENMFWNYGRKILQTAAWSAKQKNLHLIYITNFKCGPDSYIKHFVRDALGAPYLTLQFDEHSNDAGILTRCEAFLQSKGVLHSKS